VKKVKSNRVLLVHDDGREVVHYVGAGQADYALCGHDILGDSIHGDGWGMGIRTKEEVTCVYCIEIVEYCRSIIEETKQRTND